MLRHPLTLAIACIGGLALTVGFTSGSLVWIASGAIAEAAALALVATRLAPKPSLTLPVAPVGSRVVLQPGAGRVTVASPPVDPAPAEHATPEETR